MVLNGGVADGRRIVSLDWIRQSTQPSGPEANQRGGYGLQWWLPGGA
jgi:CubicO group peptidase (beta-lactamase class C family)